jgi:hypothetical protein
MKGKNVNNRTAVVAFPFFAFFPGATLRFCQDLLEALTREGMATQFAINRSEPLAAIRRDLRHYRA